MQITGSSAIVVGGTGLYLRAALAELDLRPPVDPRVRAEVERELADRGPEAMHAQLPAGIAATVHPRDRKRIARALELKRAGIEPPSDSEQLWTAAPRRSTALVGLTIERAQLGERIDLRVDEMVAAGVVDEVRAAVRAGASRTARAALGWIARWRAVQESRTKEWELRGVSFDDAFRNAMRGTVQILSAHNTPRKPQ